MRLAAAEIAAAFLRALGISLESEVSAAPPAGWRGATSA